MHIISSIWCGIQRHLFPFLEEELGPLTAFHRKVAATMEMVRIEEGISDEYWFGRPTSSRKALGRAFVAKAVNNASMTSDFRNRILADSILRRMCGWEERDQVPSESTFSRAFREFAQKNVPEQRHKALINRTLSDHLFGHISQDSTEIVARKKPVKKPKPESKSKKKRGRPVKGEERLPDPTRIERQMTMTVEEMVAEEKPKAWKHLDVTILHYTIFDRLLNISQETEDKVTYFKNEEDAIKAVDEKGAVMAILLNPTKIEEIVAVASEMEKMPHKSTYFYPKLLSGLLVNRFDISEKIKL